MSIKKVSNAWIDLSFKSSYVLNRISFWYQFKIYHNMMWMYFTNEIIMIYDYHSQMLKIWNVLKDFFSDEVDFVFVQISGNKIINDLSFAWLIFKWKCTIWLTWQNKQAYLPNYIFVKISYKYLRLVSPAKTPFLSFPILLLLRRRVFRFRRCRNAPRGIVLILLNRKSLQKQIKNEYPFQNKSKM